MRLGSVLTPTPLKRTVEFFTEFTPLSIKTMPNNKNGQEIPCCVCNKLVYKQRAYLARGYKRITCGSTECKSKSLSGENNPFWGFIHDEQTREKIRIGRRANPPKKTGPPKGYKHTPEAREKITQALRNRWLINRDVMLSYHPPSIKSREEQRYRRNFTPLQRREWKELNCKWCPEINDLVLDHIIPVSAGGTNARQNCQTLCRTCNLWKMIYIDRPYYLSSLGNNGG